MQAHFEPLFASCYRAIIRAAAHNVLQRSTHEPLVRLLSAHLPYYVPPDQVTHHLRSLPQLTTGSAGAELIPDFVVTEISRVLHSAASVQGLLRYLSGLEPMLMNSGQWKRGVGLVPLLRLQSELYSLTLPGGPRCAARIPSRAALPRALSLGLPTAFVPILMRLHGSRRPR